MGASQYNQSVPRCHLAGRLKLEKTALVRGRIDCISLTLDVDLQSPASYGHDLLACKCSRSTASRFRRQNRNKQTNGRTEAIALHPTLMRSVIRKFSVGAEVDRRLQQFPTCRQPVPRSWRGDSPADGSVGDSSTRSRHGKARSPPVSYTHLTLPTNREV